MTTGQQIQEAYVFLNQRMKVIHDENTDTVGIYVKLTDCIDFTNRMIKATQEATEDHILDNLIQPN